MKSILFSLLLFISISVGAQDIKPTAMKTLWGTDHPTGATFDTLKSSTPVYLYSGIIAGFKDVVIVTGTATEISGTTAGTATLQVSQDGTNWANYTAQSDSSTTQTLTDVTTAQVYRWRLLNWGDSYVRIKWVGSGTVSVNVTGTYSAFVKPK
jgi:hypothetical protein